MRDTFVRIMMAALILAAMAFAIGCNDDGDDGPLDPTPFGPEGRLYVLNQFDGTMYIYDTKTHLRLYSIDTRVPLPHFVQFSPDGLHYYITTFLTNGIEGFIAKFDAATNELVDSIDAPLQFLPSAIAITADSRYGYICNFSVSNTPTRIHKIDLSTMTYVNDVQAGGFTHDIVTTSDGSLAIATNRFSDNVTLVNTATDDVEFVLIDPDSAYAITTTPKYGPFGIVIDNNDSLAYIACMDALQVRVLDIAARTIVDSVDIPVTPGGTLWGPTLLEISPDNSHVYLTTRGGNSIVVINTVPPMAVVADIPVATPNPFGISISDDGSRVYVACVNDPRQQGRVYVIDGNSFTKVDSIDVGAESFGLRWRPAPE